MDYYTPELGVVKLKRVIIFSAMSLLIVLEISLPHLPRSLQTNGLEHPIQDIKSWLTGEPITVSPEVLVFLAILVAAFCNFSDF